jgi:hypothetical protein
MNKEASLKKDPEREVAKHPKKKKYVYPIRDWKEYLGESFMIVFSVLLALALTEYLGKIHEKENTKNMLKSVVAELNHNKKFLQELQEYNLQVLSNIDSTLADKKRQKKLIANGEFHLTAIAPEGALFRYFDDEAWIIAKSNNITSKINIESISILTRVYEDLDKISKVEDEVARIFFDRESRNPKQIHTTLVLIKDVYHAWAVDRTPGLLSEIDSAIATIQKTGFLTER